MGWRTIVVKSHSKLSYKNNNFIYQDSERIEAIHLSEINVIILETTNISITSMLIKKIVDEKIILIFCDEKSLPYSFLTPFYGRYDTSLQIRNQIDWNVKNKELIFMKIINNKISNQAYFLLSIGFKEKAERILELKNKLNLGDTNNVEANAAKIYFNTLFGKNFSRENQDDINAGLNYGYSLLHAMHAREIVINGCLTQLGLMHHNQFNKYNLASDLLEPFRVIIDDIVYSNKEKDFNYIKHKLFDIFKISYSYNNQEMYISNIIADYVKNVIKAMNNNMEDIPIFKYEL